MFAALPNVKRYSFALLEVVVALLLAALLMGILFESRRQLSIRERDISSAKQEALSYERMYLRLKQVFSHLEEIDWDKNRLVFQYRQMVDQEKAFRGSLLGVLSYEKNTLILSTWPIEDKIEPRHEYLLPNCDIFSCQFFSSQTGTWTTQKKGTELPLLVQLEINKKPFTFRTNTLREEEN